jgi:hypothetical protein
MDRLIVCLHFALAFSASPEFASANDAKEIVVTPDGKIVDGELETIEAHSAMVGYRF